MGVSQGLDVWVLSRKLGSWSAPHGPRPSLSTSSSSVFPPKLLAQPLPQGAEAGPAPPAAVEGFQGGRELSAFPSPEPPWTPTRTTLFPPPLLPSSSVNTGTSCTGSGFTPQSPHPQVAPLPKKSPDGRIQPSPASQRPASLGWGQAWFQWEAGLRSRDVRPQTHTRTPRTGPSTARIR